MGVQASNQATARPHISKFPLDLSVCMGDQGQAGRASASAQLRKDAFYGQISSGQSPDRPHHFRDGLLLRFYLTIRRAPDPGLNLLTAIRYMGAASENPQRHRLACSRATHPASPRARGLLQCTPDQTVRMSTELRMDTNPRSDERLATIH